MRLRDGKSTGNNDNVEKPLMQKQPEDMDIILHSDLNGDYSNVMLLFLLYILQGIPLGMAGSIPMILQNKNISYKQQAMFSFVYWPFSLKLLWAPIIDAAFFQKMGRRKTWLVPVQYLIGIFMIMLSMNIDSILGSEVPNVLFLTIVFFCLNFLAATQDIAVDGWALTMLLKRNVGYASTCNSVGQTAGYFLGNVVLLAFSSADFCNKYIRSVPQDDGLITLAGFLFFWGIVFLITTTFVWIFKHEKDDSDSEDHGILGTYFLLLKIVKLPSVQQLVVVLLTVKIGFAAADAVTGLKLIEAGVKKETLALLAVPLVPLQILLPLAISRFTAGPRPLDLFKKAIPFRLLMGLVFAVLVYWTGTFDSSNGFPYYYYATILVAYGLHQVSLYCMFVSAMGFFARVSDPAIGGTYMTMLNTLSNLGGNWPATLVLWMVDPLTFKQCLGGALVSDCSTKEFAETCLYTMVVSMMSFTGKLSLSEHRIGGTYITLMNTLANLGTMWTKSSALYLVEGVTVAACEGVNFRNSCANKTEKQSCAAGGGRCVTSLDGYYVESVVCCALGFMWLMWRRRSLVHLQNLKETAWKVT